MSSLILLRLFLTVDCHFPDLPEVAKFSLSVSKRIEFLERSIPHLRKVETRLAAFTFLPEYSELEFTAPPPPGLHNGPAHYAELLQLLPNFLQVARQVRQVPGAAPLANQRGAQKYLDQSAFTFETNSLTFARKFVM